MKKNSLILITLAIILLLTGCSVKDDRTKIHTKDINNSKYQTTKYKLMRCKANVQGVNAEKVTMKEEAYYDDEKYLMVLKTLTKIKSDDKSILDSYEKSYKKIYKNYNGIDYYDYSIKRTDDSVLCIVYINYGKVDMDEILKIEGEEDNVKLTNNKIKISDWRSFAKRFGITCTN